MVINRKQAKAQILRFIYPAISASLLFLIFTSGVINSLNTHEKIESRRVSSDYSSQGYYFEESGDPLLAVIPHRISGGVPTITITEPCPSSASANRSLRFSIFPVFTENKIISAHRSYLKQRGGNELTYTLSDKYQLPVLLRKIII